MGKSSGDPVGWRYYLTLHMGVSRKTNNELVSIKIGDKDAWSGSVTDNTSFTIDKPDLFGGDKSQGGIKGTFTALFGAVTQVAPDILKSIHGALTPGFRRVTTCIFDGLVCSNNPTPNAWSMRWRRSTKGWPNDAPWYPEKCKIVLDDGKGNAVHAMNPAHMVYETTIDRSIGRGLDASYIDDASFRAVADTLYNEAFGLCKLWVLSDDVKSFQQLVCDHAALMLGLDYSTGKITLTAIRPDYDPATLPLFDYDSGLISIDEDNTSAQQTQSNQFAIKYHDPVTDQDLQVRVTNIAAVQNAGGARLESLDFTALPTQKLALQVGQREMMTRTAGLRAFKVKLDRRGYSLKPAQPFRISAPDKGIQDMVLRCFVKVDGSFTDGFITFPATQDLYGLGATTWVGAPPNEHVPPDHTPHPAPAQTAFEAPYWMLAGQLSAADLDAVPDDAAYITTAAVRPAGFSLNYTVASQAAGETAFTTRGSGAWSPSGVLAAAIGPGDGTLALSTSTDLAQVGHPTAAVIDAEVVRVDAIDAVTGAVTIARGIGDTVPQAHALGARIYFIDPFRGSDKRQYMLGDVVQLKMLTHTPSGDLALVDAPVSNVTSNERQIRPYAPGIKINGAAYPASVTAPVTVNMARRNRVVQADQLVDAGQADITPEVGQTSTVQFYSGVTKQAEQTAIAGAAAVPWSPSTTGTYTIKVFAVRDVYTSWQTAQWTGTIVVPLVLSGTYAAGTAGTAYSSDLTISGGDGTYSNPRVTVGAAPDGLALSVVSGKLRLSGTPSTSGTFSFTVAVDAGDGQTATSAQTVMIS